MTDQQISERAMGIREARLEAYKSIVRARIFLWYAGDMDLEECVGDAENELRNKLDNDA